MIFNRPDGQVFASTAKSGEVVDFPDILRGWGLTFDQTGGIPPMEWFNSLGLRTDQAIQYFLQNGISEWGDDTDYQEGAYTRHNNKVWRAKKRNSGNEPTALNDNWEQAALTLEEVKALIPQLMEKEELDEGTSTTPRTVNAVLLKGILDKINVPYATDQETIDGELDNKAVSPKGLAAVTATTDRKGLIQIASDAVFDGKINTTQAITTAQFYRGFDSKLLIENGYQILPSGLIIQWGLQSETTTGTFPIAFPNICFSIVATVKAQAAPWDGSVTASYIVSNAQFKVSCGQINSDKLYWVAIGY